MKNTTTISIKKDSSASSVIRKMLEDKKQIQSHILKGGKLADLKDKINFATPIRIKP